MLLLNYFYDALAENFHLLFSVLESFAAAMRFNEAGNISASLYIIFVLQSYYVNIPAYMRVIVQQHLLKVKQLLQLAVILKVLLSS